MYTFSATPAQIAFLSIHGGNELDDVPVLFERRLQKKTRVGCFYIAVNEKRSRVVAVIR